MRITVLLLTLLLCGPLRAQETDDAIAEHVEATLVSELSALVPGKLQYVGLTLRMDEGWHVYWLNPGDTGLPLDVSVEAAPGIEIGEILYPAPKRLEHEGEMVDFVYDGEVTLLIPVTVAANSAPAEVNLKVRASWLVCKEACVPGSAERSLRLPVRDQPGEKTPQAAAFARTRARLATPAPASLISRWEGTSLLMRVPGAKGLVAFPLLPEETPPEGLIRSGIAQGDSLRVPYPARLTPGAPVKILLEVQRGGAASSFHWVETQAPNKKQRKEEE